jgi:hypothetical protein
MSRYYGLIGYFLNGGLHLKIQNKTDFIQAIQRYSLATPTVIIKPNWITNREGEYTEPEILDWLLEALPDQKKIIIESYTPWRGLIYQPQNGNDELKVDLAGGKSYWEFYKEMDLQFLQETGIPDILLSNNAEYINITDCVWGEKCANPSEVQAVVEQTGYQLTHTDFYAYVPARLFELREQATLISLSKIKRQLEQPVIGFSMSIKNLFGLIPHPSRVEFHPEDQNFQGLDTALADIFFLYALLFRESLWLAEGIFTVARELYGVNRSIEKGQELLYLGQNPLQVDKEACESIGVSPQVSDYYRLIERKAKELGLFGT